MSDSELPNQKPFTSSVDHLAAARGALFVVQSYYQRGFDAERTRRRLQTLMHRSRRAGLWTADQYTYAAHVWADAIHRQYGVRVTFDPAYD